MNHKIDLVRLREAIQDMQRGVISASVVPHNTRGPWRRVEWTGSDGQKYHRWMRDIYMVDGSVLSEYGVDCQ